MPAPSPNGQGPDVAVLWSVDGTRGLVVPLDQLLGSYNLVLTFQGDAGAEIASITTNAGPAVLEAVSCGPIGMNPLLMLFCEPVLSLLLH